MSRVSNPQQLQNEIFAAGGETGELLRVLDWTQTPLGPVTDWPKSLRTAIRIMLTSRQPIWIGWGPHLVYMYNDAYRSIVGGRHPWALGKPTIEVWPEIEAEIAPLLAKAMQGVEGVYMENQLLIMERNGYPEETYYTFSYSPIPDDDGQVGGIICANAEDTKRVIGERQLALLGALATFTADARSWRQACTSSIAALKTNPHDIPFALIYIYDPEADQMTMIDASGVELGDAMAPQSIARDDEAVWPVFQVHGKGHVETVELTQFASGSRPTGAWSQPAHQAVVLPVVAPGESGREGVLIVGLNPFRLFDEHYQSFIELVCGQIAATLGRTQAYEDEKRRAEALAELDRAKTLFFSNVSHEFRTPLTLMLGPLEAVLNRGTLSPSDRDELDMVRRNGLRLLKLVNSLLDFSRVESGRIDVSYNPVALDKLTSDLSSHFRSACEQAGLELHIQCEPLTELAYVDRDMWEKIVFNLLSNAFKFTLQGSITVRLTQQEQQAILEVEDTGTGIPEQQVSKVFQRFHRVENARGRTHEGSGIGLALVKELVELHGGSVAVISELDHGSRFTVTLPLGDGHLPRERINADTRQESTSNRVEAYVDEARRWLPDSDIREPLSYDEGSYDEGSDGEGSDVAADSVDDKQQPVVLVVEDNVDMRDYVARILRQRCQVLTASDGLEALKKARAERPEMILTDVMMPRLDGFGLIKALRTDQDLCDVPVIMLSARAGEEAEIEGLRAGADDYLVKPFSARELMARVESLFAMTKLRREQEENFRVIADNSPAILWTTDPDGYCTYLSKQWYEYTGGDPGQDLGFGWLQKVHPDDQPEAEQVFIAANADTAPFRLSYRLRGREGEYRWAVDTAIPRFDRAGRYLGFVGCVFDVHDHKMSEMALREADIRKDEFLATLAHELRNPLAPISNALQMMQLSNDEAVREDMKAIIDRQLKQLIRLVDDLMDVSRITRGKVDLRKDRVQLQAVIQNAVETVQPLIEESRQQLSVPPISENIWLEGDLTRLAQIFTNILNNAAKYTDLDGHIEVQVTDLNEQVVVRICDDGIGIPENKLPEIFDMFSQVDTTLVRQRGGLGIGLTLVKQLVVLHGGHIEATSSGLGQGSCFSVTLPTAKRRQQQRALPETQPPEEASGPLKVLVVDDNVESAKTLCQLLVLLGHEVRLEHDGASALATAQDFVPDMALLDIGMPVMDGYELCRILKTLPELANCVMVAQTGWGEKRHQEQSRASGFHYHLVKPVDFDQLRSLLNQTAKALANKA